MKTFSDEALAALDRGDAIVSASVEIIPQPSTTFVAGSIASMQAYVSSSFPGTQVKVGLSFLNATGTELAKHYSFVGASVGWATRGTTLAAPAGASRVRVHLYGEHRLWSGGCFDDITLTIDGVSQTLVNPGAELGTTGWTNLNGAISSVTGSTGTGTPVSPHSGTKLFCGAASGDGGYDEAYQEVSALLATGISTETTQDTIRLWGGSGEMDLPSDEGTSTFQGIGDKGLIGSSSGAIGGSAQSAVIGLSGIEAAAIEVLEANDIKDASVVIRRLIFDSSGTILLGSYIYSRGRVDELKTAEMVGGSASIQVSVEGAARGLGRRGGRSRSDADQRLVSSTDGFFRIVSWAAKKRLYWGGKKPAAFG